MIAVLAVFGFLLVAWGYLALSAALDEADWQRRARRDAPAQMDLDQ